MKRIPKLFKQFDVIATILDWIFILIAIILISNIFSILVMPSLENITEEIITTYQFYGYTITSGDANLMISLIVMYLVVFIPNTIINTKRVRSKDVIEIDEWTYRTQFLYGTLSLLTFNIFSFGLRYYIAFGIRKIYVGHDFIQSLKNAHQMLKNLFTGVTFKNMKEKRALKKTMTDSQQDLEAINKRDFFVKIFRMVSTYSFLTLIAVFIFIPFYWMILTSLKTFDEIQYTLNPRFFISFREMQWVNFKTAFTRLDVSLYIKNTIIVGVLSTVGTILTTVLAAFAFARLEFKGRDFIFSILLLTMMIPGELYIITNYITVSRLGWINTFYALIIPFMTSVFYIFFLRQTFKQIPDTLYRAARVDGCGDFKYLTRVMIPIAKPTIITITILSVIGAWDAYIWPQLVTKDSSLWLISVALRKSSAFVLGADPDIAPPIYNLQLAAITIVTVPLIMVFFVFKKFILAGVGRSGTKG
jgi:ABC-type glycerol-3-phosphate transport system permease component